jgi:hypothetical protein
LRRSGKRRRLRSSSSIEEQGADKRLTELLAVRPKLTYDEIREILTSEGFDLSRSAIGRWSIEHVETQRQFNATLAQAKALVDADPRAILLLEEATASLLQSQFLGHLQQKREVNQETLDISHAAASLTTAAAQRERVRLAREKAIRIAVEHLKKEIKRELTKQPELAQRLSEVADGVRSKLIEAEAA